MSSPIRIFKDTPVDVIKKWIDDGNDPTDVYCGIVTKVAYSKNFKALDYILSDPIIEKFPRIPGYIGSIVASAIHCGNLDVIKYLLSGKNSKKIPDIDPCKSNNYWIRQSCIMNHADIVQYLLEEQSHKFPKLKDVLYDTELLKEFKKYKQYDLIEYLQQARTKFNN